MENQPEWSDICVLKKRHLHGKWRALAHMHTYFPWSPPLLHKEYFQQGSWKQNLFAFPCSTLNFLLSFVSVGIFPYFILFLLSPQWKGLSLKFMLLRTGTHARPEDNRATYLPCSFIYLFFSFFLSPHPHIPPLASDWSWSLWDDSCLLWICIANELEEKEVELQCVEPQACSLGFGERISILTKCCQDTVGPGTAVVDHGDVVSIDKTFCIHSTLGCIFNDNLVMTSLQWAVDTWTDDTFCSLICI